MSDRIIHTRVRNGVKLSTGRRTKPMTKDEKAALEKFMAPEVRAEREAQEARNKAVVDRIMRKAKKEKRSTWLERKYGKERAKAILRGDDDGN